MDDWRRFVSTTTTGAVKVDEAALAAAYIRATIRMIQSGRFTTSDLAELDMAVERQIATQEVLDER